jgi:hypothetical protein
MVVLVVCGVVACGVVKDRTDWCEDLCTPDQSGEVDARCFANCMIPEKADEDRD